MGKGNPRLVTWEGERVITFTMEDALISPVGIQLLTGANILERQGAASSTVYRHMTTTGKLNTTSSGEGTTTYTYTFTLESINGEYLKFANTEDYPFCIAKVSDNEKNSSITGFVNLEGHDLTCSKVNDKLQVVITSASEIPGLPASGTEWSVLVDGYSQVTNTSAKIKEYDINAGKFGGNYYFEGTTFFRDENGTDHVAEFIIPNGKIQSNFTFTMASSGDPSTFTFTVDAMPGNVPWTTEKVLASIQVLEGTNVGEVISSGNSAQDGYFDEDLED